MAEQLPPVHSVGRGFRGSLKINFDRGTDLWSTAFNHTALCNH